MASSSFVLSVHSNTITKVSSVERRLKGEEHAADALKTAMKYTARISRFPFVRGVSLSGSLSKNYMDSESDIDYFK